MDLEVTVMRLKWTVGLLIALGVLLLVQERLESGFWVGVPGPVHYEVAYPGATPSSAFKCALLGTGPMADGLRKDAPWRPTAGTTGGLACMDPALLPPSTAVASTD